MISPIESAWFYELKLIKEKRECYKSGKVISKRVLKKYNFLSKIDRVSSIILYSSLVFLAIIFAIMFLINFNKIFASPNLQSFFAVITVLTPIIVLVINKASENNLRKIERERRENERRINVGKAYIEYLIERIRGNESAKIGKDELSNIMLEMPIKITNLFNDIVLDLGEGKNNDFIKEEIGFFIDYLCSYYIGFDYPSKKEERDSMYNLIINASKQFKNSNNVKIERIQKIKKADK